jgi:ribosomal protein S14
MMVSERWITWLVERSGRCPACGTASFYATKLTLQWPCVRQLALFITAPELLGNFRGF